MRLLLLTFMLACTVHMSHAQDFEHFNDFIKVYNSPFPIADAYLKSRNWDYVGSDFDGQTKMLYQVYVFDSGASIIAIHYPSGDDDLMKIGRISSSNDVLRFDTDRYLRVNYFRKVSTKEYIGKTTEFYMYEYKPDLALKTVNIDIPSKSVNGKKQYVYQYYDLNITE